MTTSIETTSWLEYYTAFSKNNIKTNANSEAFMDISLPKVHEADILKDISNDNGDSILLFFSKDLNEFHTLHSIEDLGSTNLNRKPLLVALDGFGSNALPVIISTNSISKDISKHAPTFTRLSTISDEDNLSTLEAPTQNPQRFKHLQFILLPPFLWKDIIELDEKSPSKLFQKVSKSIEDFVEHHKEDEDLKFITKKTFSNLLTFIWAAEKGFVESLNFHPVGDKMRVKEWHKARHQTCLKQPDKPSNQPQIQNLNQISEALETSLIQMTQSSQLNKDKDSSDTQSSTKSFKKCDETVKCLIFNASAPNNEIAAAHPSEDCEKFFKQPSHGSAKLFFVRTLRHKFHCELEVEAGVITSLYNGVFRRSYEDTPSNFSSFSFPEKPVLGTAPNVECMILQIKELHGKGLSNADVETALKQGIQVPSSIESMKYSILNLTSAARFFFSDHSILVQELYKVFNHIVRNRNTYRSLFATDKNFIAMFLYAIDTRIQLWLADCERAKERDEVNDSIIDFSLILEQVVTRNFHYKLPQSIRNVMSKKSRDQDDESLTSTQKFKKPKQGEPASARIQNEGKIDKWMVSQDDYTKCFKGNKALETRPKYKEVPLCHRWHSRGYCFGNCFSAASHVPSTSLPSQTKTEYGKWIETARK